MSNCMECGESGKRTLFDDFRNPPLDIEPCLCADCAEGVTDEVIEDMACYVDIMFDQLPLSEEKKRDLISHFTELVEQGDSDNEKG